VIHTVGPIWNGGRNGEDDLLASCYRGCFGLVHQHGLRSIAFPCISTGAYGFPLDRAARIAVREIGAHLETLPDAEARIVCFGADAYQTHVEVLREVLE
jgi:O-acetyl-ADP-ribose deacetylase (regulator of RNase III)